MYIGPPCLSGKIILCKNHGKSCKNIKYSAEPERVRIAEIVDDESADNISQHGAAPDSCGQDTLSKALFVVGSIAGDHHLTCRRGSGTGGSHESQKNQPAGGWNVCHQRKHPAGDKSSPQKHGLHTEPVGKHSPDRTENCIGKRSEKVERCHIKRQL